MAYLWMTGAVFYYFRYERPPKSHRDLPDRRPETPPGLPDYPLVSIIVPCHRVLGAGGALSSLSQ